MRYYNWLSLTYRKHFVYVHVYAVDFTMCTITASEEFSSDV